MPERASRRNRWVPAAAPSWQVTVWLTGVAFVLLYGGFLLWDQQSQRGTTEAEYSTYRTDPNGCKALYLTLEQIGCRTQRWQGDYAGLPSPGLLFVVAPPASSGGAGDILPYEIQALDRWVRRGNTVVIFSSEKNPLFQALGLFPSTPKKPDTGPAQPGRLTGGVKELAVTSGSVLRFGKEPEERRPAWLPSEEDTGPPPMPPVPAAEWLALFGTPSDPIVAVAVRGAGQYVVVSDPHVVTNVGLAQGGNLRFAVNLAALSPDGTILFDEAHHRDLGRGFVAYLRARGMLPLLAALLLLALLAVWRGSVRFGEPLPLRTDEHRDSAEYVRAVAALYSSAGMGRDAAAAAYEQFRRLAAASLRLGRAWDSETAAVRFQARTGRPAGEVRDAVAEAERALAKPHLTTAEAFAVAERLASVERALLAREGSR